MRRMLQSLQSSPYGWGLKGTVTASTDMNLARNHHLAGMNDIRVYNDILLYICIYIYMYICVVGALFIIRDPI